MLGRVFVSAKSAFAIFVKDMGLAQRAVGERSSLLSDARRIEEQA
jgi:hypothetical protein